MLHRKLDQLAHEAGVRQHDRLREWHRNPLNTECTKWRRSQAVQPSRRVAGVGSDPAGVGSDPRRRAHPAFEDKLHGGREGHATLDDEVRHTERS
jgi:hypothetical protein